MIDKTGFINDARETAINNGKFLTWRQAEQLFYAYWERAINNLRKKK